MSIRGSYVKTVQKLSRTVMVW